MFEVEQTSPSPRALTSLQQSLQGVGGTGQGPDATSLAGPARPLASFGPQQCLPTTLPSWRLGLLGLPLLAGASVGRADGSPPFSNQGPRGWRGIKLLQAMACGWAKRAGGGLGGSCHSAPCFCAIHAASCPGVRGPFAKIAACAKRHVVQQ